MVEALLGDSNVILCVGARVTVENAKLSRYVGPPVSGWSRASCDGSSHVILYVGVGSGTTGFGIPYFNNRR